jgi:hypothetical protein
MVKNTPFQSQHCLEFGLKIVEQDGNKVKSVRCQFCHFIGRDAPTVTGTRKRKSRTNTQYFSEPFAPQKYRSHHIQHEKAWSEYEALDDEQKRTYFDSMTQRANSMHHYLNLESDTLKLEVSATIVDVIIGDLFFRDHEVLADTDDDLGEDVDDGGAAEAIRKKAAAKAKQKTLALKLFTKGGKDESKYVATIKNTMRYNLAMDLVSTGISFRQVAAALQFTKDRCDLAKLTGINDTIVGQYVRASVAFALQNIADLAADETTWALSLACDGSTHRGQHFFDLRIRLCHRGVLANLHLVAVPQFDRHTAENTFNMLEKFLDAMSNLWRVKLISVATDGEPTMTGRHHGLVTRLAQAAEHKLLRIWCPPHQMDVVVRKGAELLYDGQWIKFAWTFSVHLRKQDNLITEMNAKCPKKTNRWTHLGRLLDFVKRHRHRLIEHTNGNFPGMTPADDWWVVVFAVAPAIDEISKAFVLSQSRSLLIAQQEELIWTLISELCRLVGAVHIPHGDEVDIGDAFETFGQWRVEREEVLRRVKDEGSFPLRCYDRLDAAAKAKVIREIARYYMFIISGLTNVRAERDDNNNPLEEDAPPVLPAQLVKLRPGVFIEQVLEPHRGHLSRLWSEESIDQVEEGHRYLVKMWNEDPELRTAIAKHDAKTTFNEAWDVVPQQARVERLRAFVGGLATAFANTTSVESDFSILKWEMDDNRTCLMHLSLEGIFQAKQRKVLDTLNR